MVDERDTSTTQSEDANKGTLFTNLDASESGITEIESCCMGCYEKVRFRFKKNHGLMD